VTRTLFTPVRLALTGAGLLLAAALAWLAYLWLTPSSYYILEPDPQGAHPVAPLISVAGAKPQRAGGGIYYVDVIIRRLSNFERELEGIPRDATLLPAAEVNPAGASDSARRVQDRQEMSRSQQIAAAVALRALGYKVTTRPVGVLIEQVFSDAPAAGRLQPTDIVVAVDGTAVRTPADLRRLVRRHRPGERVRLTVRTAQRLSRISLKTIPDPSDKKRPIIGVVAGQAASIHLPLSVRINAGDVGGPSAGLAFALAIFEKLGHDVDRGYKIAVTGELEPDGSVSPIGGVKQKTIAAERSRVDVFLVPAGDNATEARQYAHGLRVVPVKSFRQALQALTTLRPKV
jgi:PDZ domain-containing protein